MNALFPTGFPAPTATYLVLYVVTLALHVLFMNYLLAGSFYLATSSLSGAGPAKKGTLRYLLADWLPFSAGLAITTGIAPLLFLQILYRHRFYSANLLLFHRWMLIVPALIAGFYLLYLLKTDWLRARKRLWAVGTAAAFLCFAFVAWSWTENHLLSRDQFAWVDTYRSGHLVYRSSETVPRLLMWFFGALATMAVLVAWQLRFVAARMTVAAAEWKRCAHLAVAGLVLGGGAAVAYTIVMPADALEAAFGSAALPYVVATGVGALLQLAGWVRVRRGSRSLLLVSVGLGTSVVASGVVREVLRISVIDIEALYAQHEAPMGAGGSIAFALFLLINTAIIVFALRLAKLAANSNTTGASP